MRRYLGGACVLLVVVSAVSLAVGASGLTPGLEVLLEIRLPRVLTAVFAGAAMSTAGLLLQSALRNPLAEPGIMGLGPAAAVGAALSVVVGLPPHPLAIACALVVAAVLVTSSGFPSAPSRIIMIGVGINALMLSLLGLVAALGSRGDLLLWTFGSTTAADYLDAGLVGSVVVCALIGLQQFARPIDVLSLGPLGAAGMSINVKRTTWITLASAAVLAGTSIASIGLVSLLGLAVPYLTRLLNGASIKRNLVLNAVLGALVLVVSDAVARTVAAPIELPLSAVVALLSVPAIVAAAKQVTI